MTASLAVEEMTTRVHWARRCSHWASTLACGTQLFSAPAPVAERLTSHSPPESAIMGGSVAAPRISAAKPAPAVIRYRVTPTLMCIYLTKNHEQNLEIRRRLRGRSGNRWHR